jgi:two-component system cell cycle sensor histidine kinase/response regulator CckA
MANAQILVVEDEGIVAKGIQMELQNMGYSVPAVASTGEEALRKTAETLPDLVLMDIALPGDMDGVETTQHIRERFHLPVVYLTAFADEHTLQRAKITEPFGYLLKPYEERELFTTIELALYKHRMERNLQETKQWLTATLHSIGDAVLGTDAKGHVKMMNPVAEALTGWSRQEAEGKNVSEIFILIDEQTYRVRENPITRALHRDAAVGLPDGSLLVARDERALAVEGSAAPVYDENKDFAGFVLVFRDISKRKQDAEALRQHEQQRQQAQKLEALSTLTGRMANDFNNLLTGILGSLSLVLSGTPTSDPNHTHLVTAEQAAWRAAQLIHQLLGFSGRRKPRLETVDLNTAIEKMLSVLRGIMDSGIRMEFQPGPHLGRVRGDQGQIDEVLLNLCLNARDAMPCGGLILIETLNVAVDKDFRPGIPQATPGNFVCVRLSDTGRGIPPEMRVRLFEPFFTTKEPGRGAGLGLALAFGIVELHRGWIECRSEMNQGTRFDVFLPCFEEERAEQKSEVRSQRLEGARRSISDF